MNVISILNQKGGTGKTTIATNLARAFQIKEKSVVLIDSDPQGSAMDWYAAHDNNPVDTYSIDKPVLEKAVRKFKSDFLIIDGAPHVDTLAISAVKASDLVLIPVQPSQYDIWASEELINLVRSRIEITDGKLKAAFVISRAITGTKVSRAVHKILASYEIPVLNSRTHQRIIYSASVPEGLSVFDENPNCGAAMEMIAIAEEVFNIFGHI